MFGNKNKSIKKIEVIKLFKAVNYESAAQFRTLDVIDFCVSNICGEITDIWWNFGNKTWKKYSSFRRNLEKNGSETVDLIIQCVDNCEIEFGNALLNRTDVDEKMKCSVELTIYLPDEDYTEKYYSEFFSGIIMKESFNYGYVYKIPDKD